MDKDITEENKDEKRRFINTLPKTSNDHYLDQTKYRYQDYFVNPDKALELFATIPFLNGGLFECLDFKEGNKEIRFDGFSSTEKRQAFVPDKLFFADEFILDLNTEYGTKGKKYKVEGLINILDSYKFTIAENTPLEEEIALDPELLGKVFENLLASYNPETQTTARKQTGSFYTPREIVNYMVDESLIAYFKQKLDNSDETEQRIRDLFAHTIDLPEFSKTENNALIKAISEAKILDPACGSGAFPMGVLHRLVDLLNKLDPENKHWNELQKQRAIAETAEVFDSGDKEERKIRLDEINKAFDLSMNYPDYARKLFLIENCIYGVDIQQIAIQISKLRFFISLIVDQKVNDSKPNRNILSMPNLETKFVAANTLIALDKPQQMTLMAGDVERLEKELASIRHKIFFTRKYSAKKALKKKEKEKREELQTALTQSGFSKNVAGQIAGWNPFDPMQSAKFFDPETMFGFNGGFDVVIGNPPYLIIPGAEFQKKYAKFYQLQEGKPDLYRIFIENSFILLKKFGITSFITPNTFLTIPSAEKIRKFIVNNTTLISIINYDQTVFDSASVNSIVYILKLKTPNESSCFNATNLIKNQQLADSKSIIINQFKSNLNPKFELNIFTDASFDVLIDKLNNSSVALDKIENVELSLGLQPYHNTIHTALQMESRFLHSETKEKDSYIMELGGRDVNKYYIIANKSNFLDFSAKLYTKPPLTFFEGQRLIIREIVGNTLTVGITDKKLLFNKSCYILKSSNNKFNNKYLLAILNSSVIGFYIQNTGDKSKQTLFPRVTMRTLKLLPIKDSDEEDKKSIILIVEKIISAKEKNPKADTLTLEKQIDNMVYKLYDLTEEEIKIIEGHE